MPKLQINHLLIIAGVGLFFLFYLRFITPVNSWVCQKGDWVAYGHPAVEKPTNDCQVK